LRGETAGDKGVFEFVPDVSGSEVGIRDLFKNVIREETDEQ
jgi:hypothetical protein